MGRIINSLAFRSGKRATFGIIYYSVVGFLLFMVFNLSIQESTLSNALLAFNIKSVNNVIIVSLICLFFIFNSFFPELKKEKEIIKSLKELSCPRTKKIFSYIAINLIYAFIGLLIGLLAFVLGLIIYNVSVYEPILLSLTFTFNSIFFPIIILFAISVSYSLYAYYIDVKDSTSYLSLNIPFIIGIVSLLLFIFSKENIVISILFFISLFAVSVFVVNFIVKLTIQKNSNLSSYYSEKFVSRLSEKKMILFYLLSISASFFILANLSFSKANYDENMNYVKYDYVIEPTDYISYKEYLASNSYKYLEISEMIHATSDGEPLVIYATDLSMINDFYNINSSINDDGSMIICLPSNYKEIFNKEVGDTIDLEISGNTYSFKVGCYMDESSKLICFTNRIDGLNYNKVKKVALINHTISDIRTDIENNLGIKVYDESYYDRDVIKYFSNSYYLVIILSIITLITVASIYIIVRVNYYDNYRETIDTFVNASIYPKELKKMVYNSNFFIFFASFFALLLILILYIVSFSDYFVSTINSIYQGINFSSSILYLFEILIFYNIMLFIDFRLSLRRF